MWSNSGILKPVRWFTLIGGAVLITKIFLSHRTKMAQLGKSNSSMIGFTSSSNTKPSSSSGPSPSVPPSPFSTEKLEEYYSFILNAFQTPTKAQTSIPLELIHRRKVALDILKYLSGFVSEQDRIREKGLIPTLLDNIEQGHTQEIQKSSAFIISNISMQQRNHSELNRLNSIPRLFAMLPKLPSLRIDAFQLLLNLSFHQQNNSEDILIQWDGVDRIVPLLDLCSNEELILGLKVLINLSYIGFYTQQMKLDERLSRKMKMWCNSVNDDIRPRARLLKEILK